MKYDGYEGTMYGVSGGALTVVGWNGLSDKNKKKYILTCSICSSDTGLHGEGYFAMTKGHLKKGSIPCGCTDRANWTEEQYKVRLKRACAEKGIVFKGWANEYQKANKTKVLLECPEHGEYVGGSISYVLDMRQANGCAECFATRMGNYKRKDDQEMIDIFMASGGFAEGTIFRRSDRVNKSGHKKYWYVWCPDCQTEGEAHMVGFYKGSRCCACPSSRPQETYINLVKDDETVVAIKFGVSNNSTQRIKDQSTKSVYNLEQYGVWKYPDIKSCKAAERTCMIELPTGLVSKSEMPDGFTETTHPHNIDKVIHIFESNGGVRIV